MSETNSRIVDEHGLTKDIEPLKQGEEIQNINHQKTIIKEKVDSVLDDAEFDAKFEKAITTVETEAAGPVRKIDISPDTKIFPLPKDVIFFAPGWLETLEANKHLIKSLLHFGYRVISLEHPRDGGNTKNVNKRRVGAVSAVVDSVEDRPKMIGMGHSLGAIDISEYADPERDLDTNLKFSNFILTNPAGLTRKTLGVRFPKLLWNYVKNHMAQKKEADKQLKSGNSDFYNGIPTSNIATEVRSDLDTRGGEQFGSNLPLAGLEAVRVGSSSIQKSLYRLRENGHKVYVFSQENDRLLPSSSFDLKVSDKSTRDPELKATGIKYVADDKADVDGFISLAGYHNTPRNAHRLDLENNQWMSIVWIDALIRKLNGEG